MRPRIIFMGTPDFAVPALQALIDHDWPVVAVVCQPDRPKGRHGHLQAPPVKQTAQAAGIPVLQPLKIRTPEFEQSLADLRPDLIITVAYGRILPANLLQLPPRGCLNLHASLLPQLRGAAPINWALIRGARETGITLMLMDEGMDTGDILLQKSLPLDDRIDAGQLSGRLAGMGAELLPQALEDYLAGRLVATAQDDSLATKAPIMTRETGEIDWTQSARAIHNLVRGTTPWPGAYTWCDGKRLKIHRTEVRSDESLADPCPAAPGTVCDCGGDVISVACGKGVLNLLEIQTESGRRMFSSACSHNYRLGQTMGGKQH